jgi:hypothetical protein
MVKKNPLYIHPGTREKAINPSSSGLKPTARQPHRKRNPTLTSRSGQRRKNQKQHGEESTGKPLP